MITQYNIIQYDIIWYDRVREKMRKWETEIIRNNLEKIITTKFLQVKKKVTEKKVRMREGEEKGTEKVKKGF